MSLLLGFASLTVLVLGATLAHLGVVSPILGFGVSVSSVPLAVLSALGAWMRLRRTGSKLSLLHCLFGIPALVFLVPPFVEASLTYPGINDVTTDVKEPPAFRQAPKHAGVRADQYEFPREFVAPLKESYGWLAPLRVKDPEDSVFNAALAVVNRHKDWRLLREDRRLLELEAVAISRVFLFRDDFVVRIRRKGPWTTVDVRSRSREGKSDFGKNAERIQVFLSALVDQLEITEPANGPVAARD